MEENSAVSGPLCVRGQQVPVIAFYSVQGGVGKSTLARRFAELLTIAPGRDGRRPNVLLIDLDVDTQGITYRLTQGTRLGTRTVHDVIAERNPANVQAIDVTTSVRLARGTPADRGRLYLIPSAPPDAARLFQTCSEIEPNELLALLRAMIENVANTYDISAVALDCPPGVDPYSAAAARLADVPLLIGRNEMATYENARRIPERFREFFDDFQPAKQRIIINQVTVTELYKPRAQQFGVLDFIPLVADVIHETEGLERAESYRMMLFEKYISDIMKQVLVGYAHLIPDDPAMLGPEWIKRIEKLEHCEDAPAVRRLRALSFARWAGLALLAAAIALIAARQILGLESGSLINLAVLAAIIGCAAIGAGWYATGSRQRVIAEAKDLAAGGPDRVFQMLRQGSAQRKSLDRLAKLADSSPSGQSDERNNPQ